MSLTTIGELEGKIFDLYSEIATIPLPEFHRLMREYAQMLIALKDKQTDSQQLKDQFLAKVANLPIQVRYLAEPTTDTFGNVCSASFEGEWEVYNNCTIDHFHMPPGDEHERGQRYIGGRTVSGEPSARRLANQVIYNNPTPEHLTYTLGFGQGRYHFNGLPLEFDRIESEYVDSLPISTIDRVRFPEHSPILIAGIDLGTKKLHKIVVKLDSNID